MGDVWSMEQASGVTVEGQISDAIDEHDGDTGAHADIRTAVTNTATAASSALSTHNSSGSAHSDIRAAITNASTAASAALSTHNSSGAAHTDLRQAITDAGTAASAALSTHNSSGSAHADLRAKALWVDQDTTGRVQLVIGEGLTSSYSDGVLTVSCPEGQSGTSLIELHAVDGLSVPVSSGSWAKISLPGIDSRETVVNVWEAVSPTPSYTGTVDTLASASQVEVVNGVVRLAQSGHILSRLVTTGTAGNRDAVPGVSWSVAGSPSQDENLYTLGSGDALYTGNLDIPATGDLTIELWFATTHTAYEAVLAGQSVGGGSKTNTSWLLSFTPAGGICFYWSVDGSTIAGPLSASGLSSNNGSLHHVAVTRSGDTLTLWFDGVSRASTTFSGTFYNSSRVLTLGGENGSGEWVGTLKQFRLSTVALYSATFSPADPLPGPVWASSGYGVGVWSLEAVDITALTSITATEVKPGTSTARYAFSFDDGVTWEKYVSAAWSSVALSAVAASGMTASQLSSALSAIEIRMLASGAVTRVAYGLTTDGTYSPTALIAVDYTSAQEDLRVAGVHYDLRRGTEALFLRSKGSAFSANVRVMG